MSLKTLHRDSCKDLKALITDNESGTDTGTDKNDDCYLDDEDNVDTSEIIGLNLSAKDGSEINDEVEETTQAPISSDEEEKMETNIDDKNPKSKQVMSRIFPWLKKKENNESVIPDLASKQEVNQTNNNPTDSNNESSRRIPSFEMEEKKSEEMDIDPGSRRESRADTNTQEKARTDEPQQLPPKNPKNLKRIISIEESKEANDISNLTESQTNEPTGVEDSSSITHKSAMKKSKSKKVKKSVSFSTTARLISIYPHKSLPPYLKRQIWWQVTDYRNFKRTINIISQELLQHVSEDVWFLSAQDKRFLSPTAISEENEYGTKWWCQYGHSRRGLEHICSMAEGQYRQKNVDKATAAILLEQERQMRFGIQDERKLSMMAFPYTSFARDLARAVGRSDAEAVRVNFEASKLKGFRYYMPSKYNCGNFGKERSEQQLPMALPNLVPHDSMIVKQENIEMEEDDPMSELDSFTEDPTLC